VVQGTPCFVANPDPIPITKQEIPSCDLLIESFDFFVTSLMLMGHCRLISTHLSSLVVPQGQWLEQVLQLTSLQSISPNVVFLDRHCAV